MGLFGKKLDPLAEKAEALVGMAQVVMIGGLSPMSEQHQALDTVDPKQWVFFSTAATVFMAGTRLLDLRLDEKRENALLEIVQRETEAWDHQGLAASLDCNTFFAQEHARLAEAGHPTQFLGPDAAGKWVFLNVFQRPPESREDAELLRTIGVAVTHFAFQYWD